MAITVAVDAALEALDIARPLRPRPDHRHLAAQDVEELWQLVQGEAAQKPPDRGAPIFRRGRLRGGRHRGGRGSSAAASREAVTVGAVARAVPVAASVSASA